MPKMSTCEIVFRRLLSESSLTGGLAAIRTADTGSKKETLIYDIDTLEQWLFAIINGDKDYAYEAIRGFIRIRKPNNPCDGAWEVAMSAGPGFGKQLYQSAYAMSPTGKLIPDRISVSDDNPETGARGARGGWKKAEKERPSKELDHLFPPHLTPEKDDDCRRHNEEGAEFLDRSYSSKGDEQNMLAELEANHRDAMQRNNITPEQEITIIDTFRSQINKFFDKNYPD